MTNVPLKPDQAAEAHERLSLSAVPVHIEAVNNKLVDNYTKDGCVVNVPEAEFGFTEMTRKLVAEAFQKQGWSVTRTGGPTNGFYYQMKRKTT